MFRIVLRRLPRRFVLPPLVIAAAVAQLPVSAGPAANPSLRGRITGIEKLVPEVYAESAKPEAHRFTWREPSATVKSEFRTLSANGPRDVCIAAFSAGPQGAHEPIAVKLTGGRITPSTLVVTPGTRISFKNFDPFSHKLFEVKSDKWTANDTAPGSTREWAASAPGRFEIRDQSFPSIRMTVVVDPHAVEFALPNGEGAFGINLPLGDYTLKVFFDGKQVGKDVGLVRVDPKQPFEIKEPIPVGG